MDAMNKGEIIIYQTSDGTTSLDVKLEQETIWLTLLISASDFPFEYVYAHSN